MGVVPGGLEVLEDATDGVGDAVDLREEGLADDEDSHASTVPTPAERETQAPGRRVGEPLALLGGVTGGTGGSLSDHGDVPPHAAQVGPRARRGRGGQPRDGLRLAGGGGRSRRAGPPRRGPTRPVRPDAKGYRKVVGRRPTHAWCARTSASPLAATALGERKGLLAFAQLSDVHVVDHQSPARVEWTDRYDDPNASGKVPGIFASAYRPQEMLSAQVGDAMVRAINAVEEGRRSPGCRCCSRSRPATTPTTASTTRCAGTSTSSTASGSCPTAATCTATRA